MSQKGDGGDGGVEGMLVACSLGAVAKAAGHDMAGERQRQNFKGLTWVAVGGGEGEHLKGGKNAEGMKKRGSGGGLRKKRRIRKVRQEQQGLSPRLRVSRCAVGA